MDLLTVLAFPVVFVYGKLRQLPKLKESIALAEILIVDRGTTSKQPIERI
jgi:hypothetical protein